MDIIIYGIINSVSLALMAVGFTLVYGVSRLPNFAHGALYVLTGYMTWILMNRMGLNYIFSAIIALGLTGLIGAAMYQLVLIPVRGMPISEIIASYAIGLAILEGLRWGGLKGGTFRLPPFIEGSVNIFGVSVDFQRIFVVILGAAIMGALWLFVTIQAWPCSQGNGSGRAGSNDPRDRFGPYGCNGYCNRVHVGGCGRNNPATAW